MKEDSRLFERKTRLGRSGEEEQRGQGYDDLPHSQQLNHAAKCRQKENIIKERQTYSKAEKGLI